MQKPVKRKLGRPVGGNRPAAVSELKMFSLDYGVDLERLSQLDAIARHNSTTLGRIPFWLLRKSPARLSYWFKTGK